MKSTHLMPSNDGLYLLCHYIPPKLFFIALYILWSGPESFAQQSDLTCNTVTPFTPPTFAVNVDFSSGLLSCWDGDPLCIIPGTNPPANVVDNDLNNFASGEIVLGGELTLSVTDPVNDYNAGDFAGFVISSGLLDVNVFSSITLRTYQDNMLQETHTGYDLIGLNSTLFDDPFTVGFVTNSSFDEIEITFAAGIAAGFYNVHYAVLESFCAGPELACNEETPMNSPTFPMTIDYANTGSIGIGLGNVDDPENAISASTTDFASLNNLANVFDSLSICVEEQVTDYPAGTFVGFDIENLTILGLGLLDNIVITSYLNGVEQEQVTGPDLLLGVPLLNSTGRQTVGFVTTTAVDKVKFTLAQPINVNLGTTLVYSAIFRRFCEGPDLACNTLTPVFSPDFPVYISTEHTGFTGAACIGCSIEDPGNVIDNDPMSYAEIDITASAGTIGSLSVRDALTDYPANSFAGFRIENLQLLDVNVLAGVTIATYLNGGFVELASGTDILLTAGTDLLVNQGEFFAGFLTTAPFDEVQINLTNLGMVDLGTTRIYEAVIGAFCPTDIECDTTYYLNTPEFPVYVDFQLTGLEGGVCALCEVEDPDEVITASNTDYATIMITAGVLQTGSIAVRDALYDYPAGTIAGFVIDDVNDLLQADLFGSLTISTYLDGNLQEFAFGANLIDAEVLILFINPDAGVHNVGFETSLPFDEVRITVGSLVSVINIINVYGAFVDTRNSQGGNLNCPNSPIAVDDMATTPEDTPIAIDVLDNDSDPDSPLNLPAIIDPPSNGTATVNPVDSTIIYTPDPDFVGMDSLMYAICDNGMPPLCDTALVVVTVTPVTDTIMETIPEDSTLVVCGDSLTTFTNPATNLSLCDGPADGTVDIVGTCATYTPDDNFTGQDTFCVVTCDPGNPLVCDTTIIIVTVDPINDPPIAVDDTVTTAEDTPIAIDVLDNDSDPDSPLGIPAITDPPSNGTTSVNPVDSTVIYTPDPDFVGIDSFMYTICDNGMPPLCDTALVIVTVTPVTDTIIETIPEDSTLVVCADSLTTFTEPATSIGLCDTPGEGTVTITGTCVTYMPDPGFNGQDTFCVVVCDPGNPLLCDTTIIIVIVDSLNNPPVAVDDIASTPEDTPVIIDVLDNDSDPDSPLINPAISDPPNNGTVSVNPNGTVTYTPDPDFVGVDSFMYAICDDGMPPLCDTALVVVTVTPVTDTIIETIPEDSTLVVCADSLTTFTNPATGLSLCDQPSNGTVNIVSTCVTYTPDDNFTGQDTFCVYTCDPVNPLICDTTIIIVIVTPVNDPPVAVDDAATTPEDTPVAIDVLNNDSDIDSPLGIPDITDPPSNGTAMVNPVDSTVIYTPDPDFVGVDSFMYAICDNGMPPLCDTALVVVTVTPVTDTIIETIPEDSTLVVCADSLTTFTNPATGLSLCDQPSHGTVNIVSTCVTYTPNDNFTGQDTFCVYTCDPVNPLICDTTIIIVIVTPVNDPPVAVDDAATTPEDTPVAIDVLDNDSDIDSPLGIPTITEPPTHGTVSVNPVDSTAVYTPDPDFVGVDSFMYAICDNGMPPLCDTALVIVTVTPVTDTIIETIPEDSTVVVCADSLTTFTNPATGVGLCDQPSNGTVNIVGTCATYTPDLNFNGQDTFCVVTCDPVNPLICDTTIIIVIVTPVNDPPVAVDDAATTPEDTPVAIDVLDNDSDIDSPLGIPTITDPPIHGTVSVNPVDSTTVYTPDPDFVGIDSFMYAICDNGMPPLCDTALVIVTVTPVTDTIIETIPEDSTLVVCADSLTIFTNPATGLSLCDQPSNGTVNIVSTCVTYTPDDNFTGQDTFCVYTCDPVNPLICDTTIIIVIVTPVNDPPVAMDDTATTPEDTPVAIDVLDNDSDLDSPLGIPDITDPPSNGTAMVNPVDSTVIYTPDPDFVGVDSFMYAICDNGMPPLCDTALVVVTVTPVIDTIVETIPEDSTVVVCADSLTTFTNPATGLGLCDQPSNGTVNIVGTCATYTPDLNFNGQDTFCVVTCDPVNPLICDTTIIIVIVTPVNDPPVAVDDAATTPEDTPVAIDVLDNDSDIDSPLGIPTVTEPPTYGTASVNPVDSTILYTPDPDFVGVDSFTYAICDNGMPPLCDTALVIVTVTPVTDTIIETIPEDSTLVVCADSLTTFTNPATGLSLCDQPSNGSVNIESTCVTYTPDDNFTGQDTFCVYTCDPVNPLICDTTIIIVIVTPVNDPPIAVDDTATTPEDTPVAIDVLDNDSDLDSPLGIPDITDAPSNGTATVNLVDSTVIYTPDPDFVGVDSFMYAICDNGMPPLCDTALVVVTVTPVIDTIVETIPEDSTVVICADSLTTFTNPATGLGLCDQPSNGTVNIVGTCATYTPDLNFNGQDTFCVVTCDPVNPLICDTTIIIVIVTPVNDPPIAVDDTATTPEDTPVAIDILDNDSDLDSPLGIPDITDPPSNGTAMVNPVDSTVIYTPDPDFVGVDSFMYAICDNGLPALCDTALVVVTVTPVMDTLYETIPQDSSFTVCADSLTTFTAPAFSIGLCDGPSDGTVTITSTCAIYTPDPGYNGQDTFCLVVCDPNEPLLCDTTIVVINVVPPGCIYIKSYVYLEGASIDDNGEDNYNLPMRNTLNTVQVLPGQCYENPFLGLHYTPSGQPYNIAPWNYNGNEGDNFDSGGDPMQGDAGYPPTVVDWVLVSLRDNPEGNGGPICQAAACLHQDGTIQLLDSFDCCQINQQIPYYIVIEHLNHLIVMSDVPVPIVNDTLTYDFRIQQSYINDPMQIGIYAGQKEILPGVYAMYAGNGNQTPLPQADTDINFDDLTFWELLKGIPGVYNPADYNLNADTNFNDRVLWERSNGKFTSVVRN